MLDFSHGWNLSLVDWIIEGVKEVKADIETNKLTVTGKVDPTMLKQRVEDKTHKKVELISPQPKKDAAAAGGGDKKAEGKKSGEQKAEDKKPKEVPVKLSSVLHISIKKQNKKQNFRQFCLR